MVKINIEVGEDLTDSLRFFLFERYLYSHSESMGDKTLVPQNNMKRNYVSPLLVSVNGLTLTHRQVPTDELMVLYDISFSMDD